MLVGIDYGTTRTVVATVDRGNYPIVSFHTEEGDTQDWYPSLVAVRGDERLFGLDAAPIRTTRVGRCCAPSNGSWRRSDRRRAWRWAPAQ